jgi:hypothetical protein
MSRSRLYTSSLFAFACIVAAQETPIAQVRGVLILPKDLQPPEYATRDAATRQQAEAGLLSSRIWRAVKEEFCRERDCIPTDRELADFRNATVRMNQESIREMESNLRQAEEQLAEEPAGSSKRSRLEQTRDLYARTLESLRTTPVATDRRIEEGFVGNWKFFRELHRAYGGRVIFQQAGPEPLDAMRRVLEQHEKLGIFAIFDPALRTRFWAYYTTMGHNNMPDGPAFLEKPWWLHPRPARR